MLRLNRRGSALWQNASNKKSLAGGSLRAGILRYDLTFGDQIQHRPLRLRKYLPMCLGASGLSDMIVIDDEKVLGS